jgi:Mg/Co/Ni transporter MgtE
MEKTFQSLREKFGSSILIGILIGLFISLALVIAAFAFGGHPSISAIVILTIMCTVSMLILAILIETRPVKI